MRPRNIFREGKEQKETYGKRQRQKETGKSKERKRGEMRWLWGETKNYLKQKGQNERN